MHFFKECRAFHFCLGFSKGAVSNQKMCQKQQKNDKEQPAERFCVLQCCCFGSLKIETDFECRSINWSLLSYQGHILGTPKALALLGFFWPTYRNLLVTGSFMFFQPFLIFKRLALLFIYYCLSHSSDIVSNLLKTNQWAALMHLATHLFLPPAEDNDVYIQICVCFMSFIKISHTIQSHKT